MRWETDRRQEMGDRRQEMGHSRLETGDSRQETRDPHTSPNHNYQKVHKNTLKVLPITNMNRFFTLFT